MIINKRNIVLFLTLFTLFHQLLCQTSSKEIVSSGVKTVVIDPGHGGKDPGASGKIAKEKDIVLAISLKLRDYIEDEYNDVKVVLTRDSDKFVALHKRPEIANLNKADLFISIHANANPKVNAYGAETYAMGLHKNEQNLEVAKKENSVISLEKDYETHYEGFNPNSAESYIIFTLLQNTYLHQSLNYASYVQEKIHENARRYNRGVKQAGFLVLWKATMPSVLIEIGFMTNEKEERYMNSSSGQKAIALSIFEAFKEYKTVIENQSIIHKTEKDTNSKNENPFIYKPKNSNSNNESNANTTANNIYFKVQVTASGKQIKKDDAIFKDLEDIEEFQVSSIYKYAVGKKYSYQEILEYSKKVKIHFPDAFIIGVKDKKVISVKDALAEIKSN